ncbi:MAG TPA: hypothetical protein VL689_00005, partial [Paraburkholderia sp.]|nr:hypothetical protein [Paraburkholderia sp.]
RRQRDLVRREVCVDGSGGEARDAMYVIGRGLPEFMTIRYAGEAATAHARGNSVMVAAAPLSVPGRFALAREAGV